MRPLKAHHEAWLSAHPDRTEGWLRDKLAEGFDVHHLDGDHGNNVPGNLVLIEHMDHMRLHGMANPLPRQLLTGTRGPQRRTLRTGETAYRLLQEGRDWAHIRTALDVTRSRALACAKVYARVSGLPWPLG